MAEVLGATTNSPDLILGEHYFDANGDPFFDLRMSGSDTWMIAKKNASVSAPTREYSSDSDSKDAVWLQLGSKEGHGIKVSMTKSSSTVFGICLLTWAQEVYRVMTFEGSPPSSCAGLNDTVLVEYAAEYWFYG